MFRFFIHKVWKIFILIHFFVFLLMKIIKANAEKLQ